MFEDKSSQDNLQDSLDYIKKGASQSKDIYQSVKNAPKNIKNSINTGKKAIELGRKALPLLQKGVAAGSKLLAPLAAHPAFWVFIVIVIIFLLIFSLPFSMVNQGDDQNKGIFNNDSYVNSIIIAEQATQEAIHDQYIKIHDEANKQLNDYVKSHYPNDLEYITLNLLMDSETKIAENITPYIVAVNGQIQYWVDDSGIGYGLTKEKDTEYTAFEDAYKKVVKEYSKSDLFQIHSNIKDDVVEKTIYEPLYDEFGDPILDQDGNQKYKEKKIHEGNVYLSVSYSVLKYKEEDIDKAANKFYEELKGDKSYEPISLQEAKTTMRTGIMDTLELLTGSRSSVAFGDLTEYIDVDNIGFNGDLGILSEYPEMSGFNHYTRNSPIGQAIWSRVHLGSASGHYSMYDGYQCTDFVHWIFYETYGYDCGYGHGYQMASSTVNKYPDKFALSTSPAPGAIVSSRSVNHVLFVLKCDGENIWFCDGNVSGGGIRINAKWSIAEFNAKYNPIYAVPI